MKLEVLEADYEQSQTDLRLAFKRITDLQAVIEDEMESGDDSDYRCVDISYCTKTPVYDTSSMTNEGVQIYNLIALQNPTNNYQQ